MESSVDFMRMIGRLLGECAIRPELMAVGRTEITPPSFSESSGKHFVEVHEGGESATYSMAPPNPSQVPAEYLLRPGSSVRWVQKGTLGIPVNTPMVPITGLDTDGVNRLHEVVFYDPCHRFF
jgi:hypothetical protein